MKIYKKLLATAFLMTFIFTISFAQSDKNFIENKDGLLGLWIIAFACIIPLLVIIAILYIKFKARFDERNELNKRNSDSIYEEELKTLDAIQINKLITIKNKDCCGNCTGPKTCTNTASKITAVLSLLLIISLTSFGQTTSTSGKPFLSQPGIIITIILLLIPILLGVAFALVKANNALKAFTNAKKLKEAKGFASYIDKLDDTVLQSELLQRKSNLNFNLTNNELSGSEIPADTKGIISNVSDKHAVHFTAVKRRATIRPALDKDITKLILWYIGCAAFWLVVGTGVGEYLGIKFVAPDADHVSWLSFGRLRPVHTNIVFWGWASLGMIGLGYYVVPTVSNAKIHSIKLGWIALICTNIMVIAGSICLMSGINNGGGEFREYIWPVMAFFAVALILTLYNFIMTVAKSTTKEIYISNWYIISAIIFTIIVALTAYLPFWQKGIGETIVQGYFMHSGVGMWFTLYTLGLMYYFIPQQINKPIYAYSLGILAFWTQIIFYTIIGTHHFVFRSIPWWLQTVAIVGSAGMIIPVLAATINFTMTYKGHWNKVANSYTLPFFFVAVVYYFLVSMQGTVEAFKFTNLLWHFTDFTVAHAHAGFYGIITFVLWGGIYAIVPRLTGKEPPQHYVGAHFWIAFIGLLFYVVPLSIGATLRGLMWMDSKPFIDSVAMMFQYWIWRAIGGSLMFISHIIFAYNFFKMVTKEVKIIDVKEEAIHQLELLKEKPVVA